MIKYLMYLGIVVAAMGLLGTRIRFSESVESQAKKEFEVSLQMSKVG